MIIAVLRMNGVEVIECHEVLWHGIEDRVEATGGGWLCPVFCKRALQTYWGLLKRYRQIGIYDVLIVGYPGQFAVFLARLLSWLRRKPLVWDVFMSVYVAALERGLDEDAKCAIKLLKATEWMGLRLPNMLIQDTVEYVACFKKTYGLKQVGFRFLPTGADDRIFQPLPPKPRQDNFFHLM